MKEKLAQAAKFYQQGKLADALLIYHEVLQQHQDDAGLWQLVAILEAQCSDESAALESINKAIALNQQEPSFFNNKGNILLRSQQIHKAIEAFQQALSLRPQYATAYNNLGRCYFQLGKLNQAKTAYQEALRIDNKDASAHYNYAVLLARLGQMQQAIDALNTTIELAPDFPPAYGQLATIYLNEQRFADATDLLEKRLQLQPDHIETLYDLGSALLYQNQVDKAITCLEKVLILHPKHPECQQQLGNAYVKNGDPEKALNYYFRQIEINPMSESYYNIGVIFMNKNRHQDAIEYLAKAEQLEPDYLPTYLNLGAIYINLNRYQDATAAYKKALTVKPDDPEIQHILNAISGEKTPEKAPEKFLQNLFDQYATYYDKHLVGHLQYNVPKSLFDTITTEREIELHSLAILDLGVGTGLCGKLFKPYAQTMIGVDLSEKMIKEAKKLNIYGELIQDDAGAALEHFTELDLIIAADIFPYIGKLDEIFAKATQALKADGLFAFTVEKTANEPYILQQTIRYAHSKAYLDQLIKDHEFHELRFDNIVLRKHKNEKIEGYLVVLAKQAT